MVMSFNITESISTLCLSLTDLRLKAPPAAVGHRTGIRPTDSEEPLLNQVWSIMEPRIDMSRARVGGLS